MSVTLSPSQIATYTERACAWVGTSLANSTIEQEVVDLQDMGDLRLGGSWAQILQRQFFRPGATSNILAGISFEFVKDELISSFPIDVCDLSGCPGFGEIKKLVVRVLDDEEKLTKAGTLAVHWAARLERDPFAVLWRPFVNMVHALAPMAMRNLYDLTTHTFDFGHKGAETLPAKAYTDIPVFFPLGSWKLTQIPIRRVPSLGTSLNFISDNMPGEHKYGRVEVHVFARNDWRDALAGGPREFVTMGVRVTKGGFLMEAGEDVSVFPEYPISEFLEKESWRDVQGIIENAIEKLWGGHQVAVDGLPDSLFGG